MPRRPKASTVGSTRKLTHRRLRGSGLLAVNVKLDVVDLEGAEADHSQGLTVQAEKDGCESLQVQGTVESSAGTVVLRVMDLSI